MEWINRKKHRIDTSKFEGQGTAASYDVPPENKDHDSQMNKDMHEAGLYSRKKAMGNEDCFGLRECAQYGLKGFMAYMGHAEAMFRHDSSIYGEEERDDVYKKIWKMHSQLMDYNQELMSWVGLNMEIGATNIQVLELLDRSHNTLFGLSLLLFFPSPPSLLRFLSLLIGTPEPTAVSRTPVPGKSILASGHDILDMKLILDATKDKGINVYTHGELLPAHSYPKLKEYDHFIGHFGTAWQNQVMCPAPPPMQNKHSAHSRGNSVSSREV